MRRPPRDLTKRGGEGTSPSPPTIYLGVTMSFLSDLNQTKTAPAGDRSYLSSIKDRKPSSFEPSDIPGFMNPVTNGQKDPSSYVPVDQAEQIARSGLDPKGITRAEALRIIAQGQGVNPTSPQMDETAFAQMTDKGKKKERPPEPGTHFDYMGLT